MGRERVEYRAQRVAGVDENSRSSLGEGLGNLRSRRAVVQVLRHGNRGQVIAS